MATRSVPRSVGTKVDYWESTWGHPKGPKRAGVTPKEMPTAFQMKWERLKYLDCHWEPPSARPTKSPLAVTKSGSSSLAPTSHPESSPIRMTLATPTSSPTRMSSLHPTFQPSKPPSKSPTKDPMQRHIESPTAHNAAPFSVEGRANDLLDEEGDANLGGDNAEEKSVNEDEASGDIVNILGKSPFETTELATNNDAKLGGLDIVAARREFYPTSASRNTIKLPIFAYFVYPLPLLWLLW